MKRIFILLLFVFSCQGHKEEVQTTPVVMGTIGMISDVVRNVAGESVRVEGLIGPGVDPHLYKATRSDIAKLSNADLIFYNGLLLEGKLTDALLRVASSGKGVYAVTELIDRDFLLEPEEFAGHYDPHVWMDPIAWTKTIDVISSKLAKLDPVNTSLYETSAKKYKQKLVELDSYSSKVLSSIPNDSQILVTAHDAFNYFGKRYDFEVLGVQGLSTESEAGVKDIERLVELLVNKQIKSIFVESTISKRSVNALIEGAKARGHIVKIGGELFSDAMGKPGTYEGTYIGMIDHNVTTIARSLGGQAPLKGMNGLLNTDK